MCGVVVCGIALSVVLSAFGLVPLMSLLLAPLADELGLLLPLEYVPCGWVESDFGFGGLSPFGVFISSGKFPLWFPVVL
jgi:hypothetical protein